MFDTFVGIIDGDKANTISIGILDASRQKLAAKTFQVVPANFDTYYVRTDGTFDFKNHLDLLEIVSFLDENIRDPQSSRVLFEVPGVFPGPFPNRNAPPCALLDKDSIYLKVMAFLAEKGYIIWTFSENDKSTKILLGHIPAQSEHSHLSSHEPRYLSRDISRSYGDFLIGSDQSLKYSAVIAALNCKNGGAYYYWSSFGVVQSSQDVLVYLRQGERTPTSVLSASEIYTIASHPLTQYGGLEKLPLEYAIASKRYERLGKNDAIKVALLHVCKQWNITLHCFSTRDDAKDDDRGRPYYPAGRLDERARQNAMVYPPSQVDTWIIDALKG